MEQQEDSPTARLSFLKDRSRKGLVKCSLWPNEAQQVTGTRVTHTAFSAFGRAVCAPRLPSAKRTGT